MTSSFASFLMRTHAKYPSLITVVCLSVIFSSKIFHFVKIKMANSPHISKKKTTKKTHKCFMCTSHFVTHNYIKRICIQKCKFHKINIIALPRLFLRWIWLFLWSKILSTQKWEYTTLVQFDAMALTRGQQFYLPLLLLQQCKCQHSKRSK